MLSDKWDDRFLAMAEHVAQWSKDPSTQVGAVIVRPDKTIVSVGYNGFPRGMEDTPRRLKNREDKYSRIIHAEMNALLNAHDSVNGCTLYGWPISPCERCAVMIIQAGITRIVSPYPSKKWIERWGRKSDGFFTECGVEFNYVGGPDEIPF